MTRYRPLGVLTAVGALVVMAGCTATTDNNPNASPSPGAYASPTATGDAVDRAREGAETAGERIKEGAEQAGDALKDAAEAVRENAGPMARDAKERAEPVVKEAGSVLDATKQQLDVKAALYADQTIDASHIDVDVEKDTNTIVLKGSVPSAQQKAAAERVARDMAKGYAVRNELRVAGTM
ncbi:MAG TPA: BON domain-containing protein [Vicinamibacteria bacterium]|nr:BON domain-containing protein [Vicinamibacteria bacterium]